jgi:hypothetical protein
MEHTMKTVNLDALEEFQGEVTRHGTTYPIRAMTTRVAGILKAAGDAESGAEKLRLYHEAMSRVAPSMPADVIADLQPKQIGAILDLSGEQVTAVEEAVADPNAESSAPTTTTEPTPAAT